MPKILDRLKRRSEFLAVARHGRRWAAPGVVLQMARQKLVVDPATDAPQSDEPIRPAEFRVGYTASKKVGNAVQRNRAKRRLRAAAKDVLATAGQADHDYVLIGRQGTLTRPYAALVSDLQKALMRVHQNKKRRR